MQNTHRSNSFTARQFTQKQKSSTIARYLCCSPCADSGSDACCIPPPRRCWCPNPAKLQSRGSSSSDSRMTKSPPTGCSRCCGASRTGCRSRTCLWSECPPDFRAGKPKWFSGSAFRYAASSPGPPALSSPVRPRASCRRRGCADPAPSISSLFLSAPSSKRAAKRRRRKEGRMEERRRRKGAEIKTQQQQEEARQQASPAGGGWSSTWIRTQLSKCV